MPQITETFQFNQVNPEQVYQDGVASLKELGAQELTENNNGSSKEIVGVVPSMWGWGGMQIKFQVFQENNVTKANLSGFIAQLSTSPLTDVMDKFLDKLRKKLFTSSNYSFQYEKTTKFLPKMNFSQSDTRIFTIIVVIILITTVVGLIFGRTVGSLASGIAIIAGYYYGRKYLSSKKQ
jgi:hypothetical protein